MTMLADPIQALAGVPFLDDGFQHSRLAAAVCAVRHARAQAAGRARGVTDFSVWLAPARAAMLSENATRLPATPLVPARLSEIEDAVQLLSKAEPCWEPLLRLPIRFAALHPPTGAISASLRSWPQHVLLGRDAFADGRELAEQVLHEMAHQWLYLAMEVWPIIAGASDGQLFTLPSGTGGKQAWEVLGAAHVAAVLRRWYVQGPYPDPARAAQLADYADGCAALLADTELTPAGEMFATRIKEALL